MREREKRPAGLYDLKRGTPVLHVDCGGELHSHEWRHDVWGCNKCGRQWGEYQLHRFTRDDWKLRFYVEAQALNEHRLPDVLVEVQEGKTRYTKLVNNWEASEKQLERVKI